MNNPFRYSGYEYDSSSGLYYLKSRHYDPVIARFMQEDTYRGRINDPLSLNLYSYANNEPVMYYDPGGHAQVSVTLPNGTKTTGTITNGVTTLANGLRPPVGSTVHAANGKDYYMTSSGGVEVKSTGTATVTSTSSSGKVTTTSGTVVNGVTYVNGLRPSAGSIVQIGSNMYIMEATKGAVGGVQGKAITSASQVTILNPPSKIGTLGGGVNTTSGWTVITKSTADVSSKVVTYQYNGVVIGNSSYVMKETGFRLTSPTPIRQGTPEKSEGGKETRTESGYVISEYEKYITINGVKCEYNKDSGLAKLPASGTGYTTYSYDNGRNWGSPDVIASIISTGKEWAEKHPDILIQIGSLSNKDGGNDGKHVSHTDGLSIDIRPVRNDAELQGVKYTNTSSYSQEMTDDLIKMWSSNQSVKHVFFNDPDLIEKYDNVKYYSGHDDHLHVQFNK